MLVTLASVMSSVVPSSHDASTKPLTAMSFVPTGGGGPFPVNAATYNYTGVYTGVLYRYLYRRLYSTFLILFTWVRRKIAQSTQKFCAILYRHLYRCFICTSICTGICTNILYLKCPKFNKIIFIQVLVQVPV